MEAPSNKRVKLETVRWEETERSADTVTATILNDTGIEDVDIFFAECKRIFSEKVATCVGALKISACLVTESESGEEYFAAEEAPMVEYVNHSEWFDAHVTRIIRPKISDFLNSGRILRKIRQLNVNINRCTIRWEIVERIFKSRMVTGMMVNVGNIKDELTFLEGCKDIFIEKVGEVVRLNPLKINACLVAEYLLPKTEKSELKYFATKNVPVLEGTDLAKWFDEHVSSVIKKKMSEFQERDSGWALQSIRHLNVNINRCESFNGGTYTPLPKWVQLKHAVVNVDTGARNDCFAIAVMAGLKKLKTHANRLGNYLPYNTRLNLDGITFPMDLKQIDRFERLNNVSVNVYSLKTIKGDSCEPRSESECEVVPIRVSDNVQVEHVNLLMIKSDDDSFHYCWIRDLSKLVGSSLSKRRSKKWICDRCLSYFYSEEKFNTHVEDCKKFGAVKCVLPTDEKKWLEFKDFHCKERVPFIVYADLECCVTPVSACERDTSVTDSYTNVTQHHTPCSIAYYLVCAFDASLCKFELYRGPGCAEWFAHKMNEIAHNVAVYYDKSVPMKAMTAAEIEAFDNAVVCHICEKPMDIEEADNPKVRDHCHFTGRFRGAAHSKCNLNYKDKRVIPVVFHNLSGYDSHFIIKDLCEDVCKEEDGSSTTVNPGPIDVLAINKEKYKSFTKIITTGGTPGGKIRAAHSMKLRFIDSMNFMSSSLAKLASYLSIANLKHMQRQFANLSREKFELLVRKGVYPYDYMDSMERFEEQNLPSIDKFYNKLNDEPISPEDYDHAKAVWQSFDCRNLGDYSDLYLKTDVLLLCDVFENFRDVCMETYRLDAAHYITAPSLAWSAAMRVTGIKLELLTDIDMLLFFERAIRGGLSQCSSRFAEANSIYMKEYDPAKPTSYLMYYDVNNLYGWAMKQYLPHSQFKFLDEREIENFNVMNVPDENSTGYVLEVDLEYPQNIHDAHSDLPLCPENRTPPGSKNVKLLATLHDKHKYVMHYRNLKLSLSLGLKVSKIHRILSFKQSAWLSTYIDLNTNKRTVARNDFEKNFFKLMNNSVFGKTMQNVRKMRDVRLVTDWDGRYGAGRLISMPNFRDRVIFDENFAAIEMNRVRILFDKPIYVGMCILDISKIQLYKFHYSYMKAKYNDAVKLMYTDTDSLIYHIKTEDVYADVRDDATEWFDTSDYASDNPFNMPRVNKKVVGLMKDENGGKIMTKFIGLRSKMYAYEVESGKCVNKAKGVKHAAARALTFSDYHECLFEERERVVRQSMIRSVKHRVYTISQQKIALSPHDDKRVLIDNSTDTLPWGHYSLRN